MGQQRLAYDPIAIQEIISARVRVSMWHDGSAEA